jgi:hypothetical protein
VTWRTVEELMPHLKHEDPEFSEWARAMPDKFWAKYDLSAVRLGYELGRSIEREQTHSQPAYPPQAEVPRK